VAARLPEPSKLGAAEPEAVATSLPQPEVPAAKPIPRFSRPVVVRPKEDVPAPQHVAQAAPPEPTPKPKIEARAPVAPAAPVVALAATAAAPSAVTDAAPRFMVVNVNTADVLNVREGPSADHDIVGAIPPQGRGVAMTGTCRQQWCPVRHGVLTGWVNRAYLESERDTGTVPRARAKDNLQVHDNPEAPRKCLTPAARDLLGQIEARFGSMQLVSTCRPGATVAGTRRLSKHSSGNAIDFNAGARKQAVVEWLIANHHGGGTMTYRDMDHVHVDIGSHFVALGASSGVRRAYYNRYAQSGRGE
jgi:SH3-like domain-containing protein